uniref:Uncharacterized protein n=1 Tax=Arundo donax TaxID=35708 RepID=A0A0A9CG16_ARUDO
MDIKIWLCATNMWLSGTRKESWVFCTCDTKTCDFL